MSVEEMEDLHYAIKNPGKPTLYSILQYKVWITC